MQLLKEKRYVNTPLEFIGWVFYDFLENVKRKGISLKKYCQMKGVEFGKDLSDQINMIEEDLPLQNIRHIEILIEDETGQVLMLKHVRRKVFNG